MILKMLLIEILFFSGKVQSVSDVLIMMVVFYYKAKTCLFIDDFINKFERIVFIVQNLLMTTSKSNYNNNVLSFHEN